MAISVDELTKTKRTFHTADGEKLLDGSVMVKMFGPWVNIDNTLGVVSLGRKQMAFGEKDPCNSIMTAKLYASYSDEMRKVDKGDVVDRRAIIYYSNIDAETTAQMAKLNKQLPTAEGWNAVLAFDPDSTAFLLVARFTGDEQCVLKEVKTPLGAPVFSPRCTITEKGSEAAFVAEENHSLVQVVRFHIDGAGVEVVQDGDDAIRLHNLVKGKNRITVTAFLNGARYDKTLKIKKKDLKITVTEGGMMVEKM